jgi:hypothetical protein
VRENGVSSARPLKILYRLNIPSLGLQVQMIVEYGKAHGSA